MTKRTEGAGPKMDGALSFRWAQVVCSLVLPCPFLHCPSSYPHRAAGSLALGAPEIPAHARRHERLVLRPLHRLEVLKKVDLAPLRARLLHVIAEKPTQFGFHPLPAVPFVKHVHRLVDRYLAVLILVEDHELDHVVQLARFQSAPVRDVPHEHEAELVPVDAAVEVLVYLPDHVEKLLLRTFLPQRSQRFAQVRQSDLPILAICQLPDVDLSFVDVVVMIKGEFRIVPD
mmetsp:Transcript_18483/g.48754  ORF Transcript_18483/g.48754 Transcript_18483/m.48754 type:complete len:230 (-) Transcript_18483:336-1025(-)